MAFDGDANQVLSHQQRLQDMASVIPHMAAAERIRKDNPNILGRATAGAAQRIADAMIRMGAKGTGEVIPAVNAAWRAVYSFEHPQYVSLKKAVQQFNTSDSPAYKPEGSFMGAGSVAAAVATESALDAQSGHEPMHMSKATIEMGVRIMDAVSSALIKGAGEDTDFVVGLRKNFDPSRPAPAYLSEAWWAGVQSGDVRYGTLALCVTNKDAHVEGAKCVPGLQSSYCELFGTSIVQAQMDGRVDALGQIKLLTGESFTLADLKAARTLRKCALVSPSESARGVLLVADRILHAGEDAIQTGDGSFSNAAGREVIAALEEGASGQAMFLANILREGKLRTVPKRFTRFLEGEPRAYRSFPSYQEAKEFASKLIEQGGAVYNAGVSPAIPYADPNSRVKKDRAGFARNVYVVRYKDISNALRNFDDDKKLSAETKALYKGYFDAAGVDFDALVAMVKREAKLTVAAGGGYGWGGKGILFGPDMGDRTAAALGMPKTETSAMRKALPFATAAGFSKSLEPGSAMQAEVGEPRGLFQTMALSPEEARKIQQERAARPVVQSGGF